jgi:hypothetical protein
VKKYEGKHNCERDFNIKQFTAKYLAAKYVEKFRADDKMSLKNFARLIEQDFNMTASRSKLERARRIALKRIHGDELAQYNLLWDFAAEIRRSNPGSTMFVNANDGVFQNYLDARATRECDWQRYMDEMKALDQGAFDYLDAIDPRQWCKAFFEELPKCDLLLNNICEVFNM